MAKVKIPKRVAGVKIPKKVRRKAQKAVKMAESPVVREFAAAALGAAARSNEARAAANATRAAAREARAAARGAAREARAAARGARAEAKAALIEAEQALSDAGFEHETVIEIDGARLVETIRNAALSGLRSFIEGLEEGLRAVDAAAAERESAGRERRSHAICARPSSVVAATT